GSSRKSDPLTDGGLMWRLAANFARQGELSQADGRAIFGPSFSNSSALTFFNNKQSAFDLEVEKQNLAIAQSQPPPTEGWKYPQFTTAEEYEKAASTLMEKHRQSGARSSPMMF